MGKIKLIVGVAVVAVAIMAGGQVGLAEWTNLRFQDELHDLSTGLGSRAGMMAAKNDEELRTLVIRKADEHGITLEPQQVTIEHPPGAELVYLAAEYDVTVTLPWYTFALHFKPESTKKVL